MHHFSWDVPTLTWVPTSLPTLIPYGSTHRITSDCPVALMPRPAVTQHAQHAQQVQHAQQAQPKREAERSVLINLDVCLGQVCVCFFVCVCVCVCSCCTLNLVRIAIYSIVIPLQRFLCGIAEDRITQKCAHMRMKS